MRARFNVGVDFNPARTQEWIESSLLGAKPEAPLDESVRRQRRQQAVDLAHRERVAAAGGELLGATFRFLGGLVASRHHPTDGWSQLALSGHPLRRDLRYPSPRTAPVLSLAQSLMRGIPLPEKAAVDAVHIPRLGGNLQRSS